MQAVPRAKESNGHRKMNVRTLIVGVESQGVRGGGKRKPEKKGVGEMGKSHGPESKQSKAED